MFCSGHALYLFQVHFSCSVSYSHSRGQPHAFLFIDTHTLRIIATYLLRRKKRSECTLSSHLGLLRVASDRGEIWAYHSCLFLSPLVSSYSLFSPLLFLLPSLTSLRRKHHTRRSDVGENGGNERGTLVTLPGQNHLTDNNICARKRTEAAMARPLRRPWRLLVVAGGVVVTAYLICCVVFMFP